jgi:hypothetical protein
MLFFQLALLAPKPLPTLLPCDPRLRSFIAEEFMLEARFDRALCTLVAFAAMVEAIPVNLRSAEQ